MNAFFKNQDYQGLVVNLTFDLISYKSKNGLEWLLTFNTSKNKHHFNINQTQRFQVPLSETTRRVTQYT